MRATPELRSASSTFSARPEIGAPPALLIRLASEQSLSGRRPRMQNISSRVLDHYVVREKRYRHRDGSFVWARVNISVYRDAKGECQHFISVIEDITDARALEAQLRQASKMDAIGQLAAGVAHDFNNLLSVIMGYSEMLAADLREADPMRADLNEITGAGMRATELTRQLLAFSRQLSVNARDAMPNGGRLSIETAEVRLDETFASEHVGVSPGPHILLTVRDAGVGMDKATLARMLEPFFTTKEVGKGTGLGLATVFGIVRQSGGTIWVDSEPGKGTTFQVYFSVVDGAPVASSVLTSVALPRLNGSETILLVEDEESVRILARTILRKYGYDVLEAQTVATRSSCASSTPHRSTCC